MFKQLKLRQQANIDYQQARGTAHKYLLQTAKNKLNQRQNSQKEIVQKANENIYLLKNERDRKLKEALTHHIVHDRLTEIPGIGKARSADIIRRVYNDKITDLYHAQIMLSGIGEQTQLAINQWIHHYQKNFTKLLAQDFPGKSKIEQAFQPRTQAEKRKIALAKQEIQVLQALLDKIQTELNWLEKIKPGDFHRKLKNPVSSVPELDHYIQGVFAEWEPMPIWFRDILQTANVTGQMAHEGNEGTAVSTHLSTVSPNTIKNNQVLILIIAIMVLCCGCLLMTMLLPESEKEKQTSPTATPTLTVTETAVPTKTPTLQSSPINTVISTPTAVSTKTPTTTTTPTVVPQPQVEVIISVANVRANPETDATVIGTVKVGDVLPVLAINEEGIWYQVELPNGKIGWIGSTVTTPITDNMETP